jgi:predicted permease
MSDIATVVLPAFGLVLAGYLAGRSKRLPLDGFAGLNFLVLYIALPALFFRLVAVTPFHVLANLPFVLTTTFSTYCAFAVAFSFGALIHGGAMVEATVEGLSGSYANIALMGPGLTLAAFGDAAGAPTALMMSFDTAMLAALTPLMMALGAVRRTESGEMLRFIAKDVALNPVILATLAGFLWSATGLKLPGTVAGCLSFVGAAAPPVGLFTVGVRLAAKAVRPVGLGAPVLISIKLVAHPLIVYLLLGWIGGFDPVWMRAAILCAALPPAIDVVDLARKYGGDRKLATTTIVFGTAAAAVTVTVTLALMLFEVLPAEPFR